MVRPFLVCIEGNIGCGKSTVLRELRARGHTVFFEPLEDWKYIFSPFCQDPKKHCFAFQIQVVASFADQLWQAMQQAKQSNKDNLIFFERSIASAETFVSSAVSNGWISDLEHQAYQNLVAATRWDPDMHIFIDVSASTCLDRISQRARPGEGSISIARLNQIKAAHEESNLCAHTVSGVDAPNLVADRILVAATKCASALS